MQAELVLAEIFRLGHLPLSELASVIDNELLKSLSVVHLRPLTRSTNLDIVSFYLGGRAPHVVAVMLCPVILLHLLHALFMWQSFMGSQTCMLHLDP